MPRNFFRGIHHLGLILTFNGVSLFTLPMNITLDHIIPFPLRDKIMQRPSDVWNRLFVLDKPAFIKVNAPSGSGKTTLVHTIWSLRNDHDGKVMYDGRELRSMPAEQIAQYRQQKISVVFQDLRLFGQLTARENLELKRQLTDADKRTADDINRMAETLGVQHVLHQPAYQCSYGEQQRIAIIRALLQPFEWLIMDEPFSHLDANNTRKAAQLIAAECHARKAGFLLTDLDEDDLFDYDLHLKL